MAVCGDRAESETRLSVPTTTLRLVVVDATIAPEPYVPALASSFLPPGADRPDGGPPDEVRHNILRL